MQIPHGLLAIEVVFQYILFIDISGRIILMTFISQKFWFRTFIFKYFDCIYWIGYVFMLCLFLLISICFGYCWASTGYWALNTVDFILYGNEFVCLFWSIYNKYISNGSNKCQIQWIQIQRETKCRKRTMYIVTLAHQWSWNLFRWSYNLVKMWHNSVLTMTDWRK